MCARLLLPSPDVSVISPVCMLLPSITVVPSTNSLVNTTADGKRLTLISPVVIFAAFRFSTSICDASIVPAVIWFAEIESISALTALVKDPAT